MRILKRCLAISVLDLGMNLPNYLLRLYLTVFFDEPIPEISGRLFTLFQDFSQILYFAQVGIFTNALAMRFLVRPQCTLSNGYNLSTGKSQKAPTSENLRIYTTTKHI
jgi:hypothetical protein